MGDFGATYFSKPGKSGRLKKGWTGVDKPSYSEKQKEAFRNMIKKKVNRYITKTDSEGNEVKVRVSKSEMKQHNEHYGSREFGKS